MKILNIFIILTLLVSPMAEAQTPFNKFGRGLTNLFTGWIEVPKNIYDITVEKNFLLGITIGLIEGIGMFIIRTGCGVYEIVTFFVPVPDNYVPLLLPEFVLEKK